MQELVIEAGRTERRYWQDLWCYRELFQVQGGMRAALIEIGGFQRDYYFFDSFEGLPPAKAIDVSAALVWQADTASPSYHDNCTASVDDFRRTVRRTGCPEFRIHVFRGVFEQTFPTFTPPPIAVLRLDADWYDSTMECLRKFWDFVLRGGLILIDHYYTWDGCSRALHDFLSESQSTGEDTAGAKRSRRLHHKVTDPPQLFAQIRRARLS